MRDSWYFLRLFGFVFLLISSVNSQDTWNLHKIKTEIVKMNEKFKFLSDEIDEVKVNKNNPGVNQDQLTNQLNRWKSDLQSEISTLTQELKDLSVKLEHNSRTHQLNEIKQTQELEHLKMEKDSMQKEVNALRVKLEQEVSDSKTHEIKCKQREEDLRNEIQTVKQQLSELDHKLKQEPWKNETNAMNKELNALRMKLEQDNEAHEARCEQGVEALRKEVANTTEELSEMKKKDVSLKTAISLTKPHIYLRSWNEKEKEPNFVWTVNDIKNKVNQTNFELLSEVFPLKGYSFGAQAKLTLNPNNQLVISLSFKDLNKSANALNLKLIPAVYFTYKDQQRTRKIIRQANQLFSSTLQYDSYVHYKWLILTKDIASDTISIDIHVEPPEVTQRGYSYDGSLVWAIEDYRKKREMEQKSLVLYQLSPYFYTGPKGYRVQSVMRLNGYGINGLTMSMDFLTGPYDADLSRSFKHKTTFTLLHPTDPSKHVVKSVLKDLKDGSWYMMDMGTHPEIEALLDNDTLYYQFEIVPA